MVAPGGEAHPTLAVEDLHRRYAAYRRGQAARLVRLMPREAVRPLYRRARRGADPSEDPLAVLVRYCEGILPLPPFEVWCEDFMRSPDAHMAELDDGPDAPTADAPSPVEARAFEYRGLRWVARLESYRDGGLWRGYIAFADEPQKRVYQTAPVFCEPDPATLRERFRSFDSPALEAFLRSALP